MKHLILSILAPLMFLTSASASASGYLYYKLQMKNYDQMQTAVNERVRLAEKIGDSDPTRAKSVLQDALLLILSRPDTDDMVSELTPLVREPLRNLGAYTKEISSIVDDAIINIGDKHAKPATRTTGLFILKNVMSELRPEAQRNKKVKKIFEHIRDAKIKIPDAIKSDLFIRSSMKPGASPSDLAAKILKSKNDRRSDF